MDIRTWLEKRAIEFFRNWRTTRTIFVAIRYARLKIKSFIKSRPYLSASIGAIAFVIVILNPEYVPEAMRFRGILVMLLQQIQSLSPFGMVVSARVKLS